MYKKLITLFLFATASLSCFAAERAPHFAGAKTQAAADGKDIAIFLHGSDWNRLGEYLKQKIWDNSALEKQLPDFVLSSIDHPENAASSAIEQQRKSLPALATISKISAQNGTIFKKMSDGSYLAQGANPAKETYVIECEAKEAISAIWLEALTDESLPNKGPGRYKNSNFSLTEITLSVNGKPVKFSHAWADHWEKHLSPKFAIDGNSDNGEEGWVGEGHRYHNQRNFIAIPAKAIKGKLRITLHFNSKWEQHVIGRLRIRLDKRQSTAAAVKKWWHREIELKEKNASFKGSTQHYPAVILCDAKGEAYAAIHGLKKSLDASWLSKESKRLQSLKKKRELFWTQANTKSGAEKAKLLFKGLEVEGLIRHKKLYGDKIAELKKCATENDNAYVRRYAFNAGWVRSESEKLRVAGKNSAALTFIDSQISHKQNKYLPKEEIQKMYLLKFHIYRQWKGQEDQRFEVMTRIAAINRNTHTGVGAIGYLMMHRRGGPASITHGWTPKHTRAGKQTLSISLDTAKFFDHKGDYALSLRHDYGKGKIILHEVALYLDGEKIASQTGDKTLTHKQAADFKLNLSQYKKGQKLQLKLKLSCEQINDVHGRISVRPTLD